MEKVLTMRGGSHGDLLFPLAISGVLDVLFFGEELFIDSMLSPLQIGWLLLTAFFVFILAV